MLDWIGTMSVTGLFLLLYLINCYPCRAFFYLLFNLYVMLLLFICNALRSLSNKDQSTWNYKNQILLDDLAGVGLEMHGHGQMVDVTVGKIELVASTVLQLVHVVLQFVRIVARFVQSRSLRLELLLVRVKHLQNVVFTINVTGFI